VTSVLPIAFGLFSLQFPAGLVLYFLVSNTWRLGQQELIMRKITRPGQAALASSKKDDDVIDVDSGDTSAFPRAAGGLRKLFQIPGAANGGEPPVDTENGAGSGAKGVAENGTENGAKNGAKNGAAKPSGTTAGAAKGSTAKGSSGKSAQSKSTPASTSSSASSSGSGASSGARRRNNKKRKRR
jgi:YidC/Oxa1 family membrane protein insertase